jgi:hypothetical protein
MTARTIGGPVGEPLTISMYSANSLAWAVGDLCALDTGANFTVKDTVNDTAPFGRVVAIEGPATATSATSTILTVEVFGFNAVVELPTSAAIDLGVSIQTNVNAANNIETTGGSTGRTLTIGCTGSGSSYVATVLV